MTAEEAMNEMQRCLKAHGLLGCLLTEVNLIREDLRLPPIDKEGYETPWCASCDAQWSAMCARFDHTMVSR